ncbi:F-box/FBD/LRR-repeat protein At1g13570 [Linum grandiflorum]
MNFDGFTHLKINAPNLQFFDIGGIFDDVSFKNTCQLTLVSIGLYVNLKNDRNLATGSSSKLLSFFANLPHIRRLEVQSYFLKARPEEQSSVGTGSSCWEDEQWKNLFAQLRFVKMVGISGVRGELDCINFVLSNSPMLEKMTIKPSSVDGGWELMKELLRFRRASVLAEIVYVDP